MWEKPTTWPSAKMLPAGNGYYIIDGQGVCYNTYPVKQADAETFVCHFDFAKDKARCYRMGEPFKDADPASFEVLNYYFAKDKYHIYNIGGADKKVDHETFEVLDTGFQLNEQGRPQKITSYAKDKNVLWMMEYYSQKPIAIKGIDTATFGRINGSYAKDSRYVLWRGKKLKKADPRTFTAFNTNYGKDKTTVFFQELALAGADHATFETVETNVTIAKDKNRFYHFGEEITAAAFAECLKDVLNGG
ncbi:DKNYY family protein [Chitinophaga eiseniae]|uniref:DKNYY family protein n=1 Tax=Chitinophaga eiseniae TaxID=634771 RepID=A0A1T4TUV4_9BACT|nr:DKNYY domain-containing protein [Chitinophaga eiseniae]SKA44220.1 DKNYY family protein [Chitinophaga eiseniae]